MSRTRAVVWGGGGKIKCSNVCIVPEGGSVVFISHLGKLHFTPVTTVTNFAGAFFFLTFAFILPFLAHISLCATINNLYNIYITNGTNLCLGLLITQG